jgi:hypothetical protein
MELEDLVRAIATGDLMTAREWVADAQRLRLQWARVPRPTSLGERDLAIAAGWQNFLRNAEAHLRRPGPLQFRDRMNPSFSIPDWTRCRVHLRGLELLARNRFARET